MQNVFIRPQGSELIRRLGEPRRFIQVIAGPRQVGKTTLVLQVENPETPKAAGRRTEQKQRNG